MKKSIFKRLFITGLGLLTTAGLFVGSQNTNEVQAAKKSSSLVIYFSKTGNTERAAKQIQRDTGARILRITPRTAYPNDYDATTRVAQNQLRRNIHPAIRTKLPSIRNYRHIYIGFPTWWGQPPMIIHTLFDRYNFRGKTITPFTTSAESPISSSMPVMRRLARNDHARLTAGYRYTGNNTALRSFLIRIKAISNSHKARPATKKAKRTTVRRKTRRVRATRRSKKTVVRKKASTKKKAATKSSSSQTRNSLVVYFSLSGTTAGAARKIARLTNSDIYRIEPQNPYRSYDDAATRGERELRSNARPAIRGTIPDWNRYSIVYVGFPTWWAQPPMIIHTLFETYNFRGKTVAPFTTSMSTPMSSSMPYIRSMAAPYNARVLNGFRYDGNNTALRNWLRGLKLIR